VPAARAVDLHGLFRGATKCDESLRLGPEPEEEWPREQRADSASRSSRFDLQRRSMASTLTGRWTQELSAYNVFRAAIDGGRATVWNVERAYRTGRGRGCRVGGRGIYHDHALCRRPRIGA
jgi:hypothetical protein